MSEPSAGQGTIPFTFGVELEFDFSANTEAAKTYFNGLSNQDEVLFTTEKKLRPNLDDIKALVQVSQILNQNGGSVHVLPQAKLAPDYSVWQVTGDMTARIGNHENMNDYLPDELRIPHDDFRGWQDAGVELISPPLEVPSMASGGLQGESLLEIKKYLDKLQNQATLPYRILSGMPYTGLHVHIGVHPDNREYREMPLKVIQHLSFLLIQYEDVMCSFHPFSRRGIRDMIFAKDMTAKKLTDLMDRESTAPGRFTREKFVNFEPLKRRSGESRTVEFRQHQGTLSIDSVSQWVLFLTALMRLAEQRSGKGPAAALAPSTVSPSPLEKARELLGLLGLDDQACSYWLSRFERYKTVPQDFSDLVNAKPCPGCKKREQAGR